MGTGHASDPWIRFHASSGRALSALGLYLTSSGKVDFILLIEALKTHSTRSVRTLSFDAAQVMEASDRATEPLLPSLTLGPSWIVGGPSSSSAKPMTLPRFVNMRCDGSLGFRERDRRKSIRQR